jgi:hypothetical protein
VTVSPQAEQAAVELVRSLGYVVLGPDEQETIRDALGPPYGAVYFEALALLGGDKT